VLGRIRKGYEHVHFSEFDDGVVVNPLARGHLTPYTDRTAPTVSAISFRSPTMANEVIPELISGRVVLLAQAQDKPQLPVPGIWNNLPVAPAALTWRVERATDGRIAIPQQVAFDFRRTIPSNGTFWKVYGRGSRQNMTPFAGGRAWRQPGVYRYRLTAEPFDTTRLTNGIYRLVVTAFDIRGNSSSNEQIFIVRNAATV
jgi:hypothetical protein